jgi:D-alanyl-D-alanine-carboxypeptidase/D-alanyl-D-alanine-endopeptidase
MRRPNLVRLLLLLPFLAARVLSGQAPAASPLPDAVSIRALGADLFQQSGVTGMVLVVVRDDQTYFFGYGETAPGSNQSPTQDSVLRLCSLTKIFTTDVLAKLAADGTVHLDDPLQQFAPDDVTVPTRTRPITLANLATHTSGLPRELGAAPRHTPHFTFPDYRTRWQWLPRQNLRTVPGTAAVYSNIGYDLLSDALQSAAHKPYAALLAERTLNPLHMWNTTFFPSDTQCGHLLIGARDEGPCTVTEDTAGSSGLYSTATDMAIWLKYLLGTYTPAIPAQAPDAQSVRLLPSDLISQVGLSHAGDPTGVGLGWIHLLPLDSPSHIVEKTGGGAGFQTYIALNHSSHTAIFVAATDGSAEAHVNLFEAANNVLLAAAGLPQLPPPPPRPVVRPRHKQKAAAAPRPHRHKTSRPTAPPAQ